MKFSIILTSFNVEPYIDSAIKSVIPLLNMETELVIIDDASNDGTWSKITKYDDNPFITIHNVSHRGLGAARNYGMDVATGDYILFLDGDDFFNTQNLEIIFSTMGNQDLVIFGWKKADESGKLFGECKVDGSFIGMDRMAWNKIYKASLVKDIKFPEGVLYEDVGFTSVSYLMAQNILFSPLVGYGYRQRQLSITRKKQNSHVHLDVLVGIKTLKTFMDTQTNIGVAETRDVKVMINNLVLSHIKRIFLDYERMDFVEIDDVKTLTNELVKTDIFGFATSRKTRKRIVDGFLILLLKLGYIRYSFVLYRLITRER
ncbi:glycosyltransferase family 2 protein [Weissella confusa]|uniref:glycosyltransferase family 2 protein n=1 Tax=Weissella TaxID=46255 RepID=UPI0018F186FB|nr:MULTISPECIES: glycosyltransferase family 2 protein [Weissella]MBJ7620274.1 glycosyltransferase family 2 protein [Weissella confusa]MBJ7667819.1 glycosyltransferase family 2 protein [Weissella confusa]MBJ7683086.1 glycosyltransferase family 2 protein [Weissella confusa]MBJ7685273.1 glycosyltransferase family 2 protein [Weissella confusa]MBJ7702563.1 glycosyltransferase family 2 protein [Weissella confusa]